MRYSYCSFFSITYIVRKNASDKQEQILVMESLIDDTDSISINLCNCKNQEWSTNYLCGSEKLVRKFRSY